MSMDVICFNAVYDMNGAKGPNQIGKDIGFVGSFYNNYSTNAEAVLPHDKPVKTSEAPNTSGTDHLLRSMQYCKNLSDNDSWIVPNVDELSLLYINLKFLNAEAANHNCFWSHSPQIGTPYFRHVCFSNAGYRHWNKRTYSTYSVLCVRNTTLK